MFDISDQEVDVRVSVSPDRLRAELILSLQPHDSPQIVEQVALYSLEEKGVRVTDEVRRRTREIIEGAEPEEETRGVIARGVAAVHGKNAEVAWRHAETDETDAEDNAVNHYAKSDLLTCRAGDVLGVVTAATDGEDGVDVYGGSVAARRGRDVPFQFDESILRAADGRLIAQTDGLLVITPRRVFVSDILDVSESVDFSVGNIDFDGSVNINRGIKDNFHVRASGDIDIRGLVEAASIVAGGNLVLHAGMAGRNAGRIAVSGNLTARYLDSVAGEVEGALTSDREIINCRLSVEGGVDAPNASLIGGVLTVNGPVVLRSVGSEAYVPTEIVLGRVPRLERWIARAEALIQELIRRHRELENEGDQLEQRARLTPDERERQTLVSFEIRNVEEQIETCRKALKQQSFVLAERRGVDITVTRKIFTGTMLRINDDLYRIRRDIRGPLHIGWTRRRILMLKRDGDERPCELSRFAMLECAA